MSKRHCGRWLDSRSSSQRSLYRLHLYDEDVKLPDARVI